MSKSQKTYNKHHVCQNSTIFLKLSVEIHIAWQIKTLNIKELSYNWEKIVKYQPGAWGSLSTIYYNTILYYIVKAGYYKLYSKAIMGLLYYILEGTQTFREYFVF